MKILKTTSLAVLLFSTSCLTTVMGMDTYDGTYGTKDTSALRSKSIWGEKLKGKNIGKYTAEEESESQVSDRNANKKLMKEYIDSEPDQDSRKKVGDVRLFPYTSLVFITAKFLNDTDCGGAQLDRNYGTGALISSTHILTAAHNVYNRKTQRKCQSVDIQIGRDGETDGVRQNGIKHTAVMVNSPYQNSSDLNDEETVAGDFAVICLGKGVDYNRGYFGIHSANEAFLQKSNLNLVGYPGQYIFDKKTGSIFPELRELAGKAESFNNLGVFYHQIQSSRGQSGAPIWYFDQKEKQAYIVGIHSGTIDKVEQNNRAAWITPKSLDAIKNYLQKDFFISLKTINQNWAKAILGEKKHQNIKIVKSKNVIQQLVIQRENEIEETGTSALASEDLSSLVVLKIYQSSIKEHFKILSNSSWSNLLYLDVSYNNLQDKELADLCEGKWDYLQIFCAAHNSIMGSGIKHIGKNWPNLQVLDLMDNPIGLEQAQWNIPQVKILKLDKTPRLSGLSSMKTEDFCRDKIPGQVYNFFHNLHAGNINKQIQLIILDEDNPMVGAGYNQLFEKNQLFQQGIQIKSTIISKYRVYLANFIEKEVNMYKYCDIMYKEMFGENSVERDYS